MSDESDAKKAPHAPLTSVTANHPLRFLRWRNTTAIWSVSSVRYAHCARAHLARVPPDIDKLAPKLLHSSSDLLLDTAPARDVRLVRLDRFRLHGVQEAVEEDGVEERREDRLGLAAFDSLGG